jgi:hypothetical protein
VIGLSISRLKNIANFDKTNVDFSIDATTTLDTTGLRSINVKAASSTHRATAMLGVSMAGEKLAPFLIFTGVSKWVWQAWESIEIQAIINTWKKVMSYGVPTEIGNLSE